MHCNSCDQDVNPVIVLDPARGKLWQCPSASCSGAVLGPYEEPGMVTGPDGDKVDLATVQPMVTGPPPAVVVDGVTVAYRDPPPERPTTEPPNAEAIADLARRRLEFVRAEIAKLRGYEAEEEKLSQMLAPASGERSSA